VPERATCADDWQQAHALDAVVGLDPRAIENRCRDVERAADNLVNIGRAMEKQSSTQPCRLRSSCLKPHRPPG